MTLVAVTHVPTNSGLIQQVEEVGLLCKKFDIWFLLDACQSVGQLPIDANKIGCDFISATGRKFLRGPRGTGFLYVSDEALHEGLEPSFIDMRGADWVGIDQYEIKKNAERFETWEFSYASLLGLKASIGYANDLGMENIQQYNKTLSQTLRENLSRIAGVNVLDRGSNLSSIVTFYVDGMELKQVMQFLDDSRVFYSVSTKNAALIDFARKGVDWAIRFSPHYFNTIPEINELSALVATLVSEHK